MRALGHAAVSLTACLGFFFAVTPLLALLALGLPGLGATIGEAGMQARLGYGLALAACASLAGLPFGLMAALSIWGQPRTPRRIVLGCAILPLLVPAGAMAGRLAAILPGSVGSPHKLLAFGLHAALAACLSTLILTGFLNGLARATLRGALLCGASPLQAFRLAVLPALVRPLTIALGATTVLGLGGMAEDAALGVPSLAATLSGAILRGDTTAASTTLLLGLLALAILGLTAAAGVPWRMPRD